VEGACRRARWSPTPSSRAELTLGSGPIADELRSLGLPRRALMTTWMEKMRASFGAAEKL
jgi:hypothetical protein